MTTPCPDCDDGLKAADISPGTQPCILTPEEREEQYQTMVKRLDAIEAEPEAPDGLGQAVLSLEETQERIRGREVEIIASLVIQMDALKARVEALEAGEFGR